MPTSPYATLRAALNGGAPTTGGIVASNADVVQLSAESTVGWTQQKWELYSFYSASEFPLPSGWTLDAGTGAYYYSASATPPPFTLPAGPAFGKWLLRLTVNNGLNANSVADPSLIDQSTALSIPSPAGLLDLAWAEGPQFSAFKKWVGDYQINLRALDAAVGAAATPGVTVAAVTANTNTAGALNTYSRSDHAHTVSTQAPSAAVKSDFASSAAGSAATLLRSDAVLVAATDPPVSIAATNTWGSSQKLSRADHQHDHGTLAGGDRHAVAVPAGAAGFLSGAFATDLTNATKNATGSTLVMRGAGGEASFGPLVGSSVAVGVGGLSAVGFVANTPKVEVYAATVTFTGADGNRRDIILTGDVIFAAPTGFGNGSTLEVFVEQDVIGNRVVTWNAAFVFSVGLSGTLVGTVQYETDVLIFKLRSTYWVCISHTKHTKP